RVRARGRADDVVGRGRLEPGGRRHRGPTLRERLHREEPRARAARAVRARPPSALHRQYPRARRVRDRELAMVGAARRARVLLVLLSDGDRVRGPEAQADLRRGVGGVGARDARARADVQEREPDVRGRVVAAEKLRQERRSGHRRVHPDLHVSRRTPRAVTGPESGSRPTGAPLAAPDTAQGAELEAFVEQALARGTGRLLGRGYQASVYLLEAPIGRVVVKKAHESPLVRRIALGALRREAAVYERLRGVPG